MRLALLVHLFAIACNRGATHAPAPPARDCDVYPRARDAAQNTPPLATDDAAAQVIDACGCASTIHTTSARADALRAAYTQWRREGCGPVNCDTPCQTIAPP